MLCKQTDRLPTPLSSFAPSAPIATASEKPRTASNDRAGPPFRRRAGP
jgi:hypothetical protein